MLQKRINKNSIPYGLAVAGVELTKGALVELTYVAGVATAILPSSVAAGKVYGFAFNTVRDDEGTYKTKDKIPAGARLVIYSLEQHDEWATSEYVAGTIAVGDKVTFATTGKIVGIAASEPALFVVTDIEAAGSAYEDALLNVRVL